ncbi:MAG TPA: DUF1697 domain-containing protein [Vicinamibacteria bacterium]|nr:DUF1697 domain-containing protein [Vicinamibacteria bacterium]
MPRYAAVLRGVMPTNAKMPALKAAFESAGFTDVKTILGSGNVVFTARKASEAALERRAEAAMARQLGRTFPTIVRSVEDLQAIVAADPYADFPVSRGAKRVVTFLRAAPKVNCALPVELDGARVLCLRGREVYSDYLRTPKGPVFMTLIERTLGKEITTRTWDTVVKLART